MTTHGMRTMQTVTFQRVTTVTITFDVDQPMGRKQIQGWADIGMLDTTMRQHPDQCTIDAPEWDITSLDPELESDD